VVCSKTLEFTVKKHPCLPNKKIKKNKKYKKAVVVVGMGKIVISVIAATGYNDQILGSTDRRYE